MPSAVVVTPPFSPNTANPLLGPALLRAHAEHEGIRLRAIDLNIRYMATFDDGAEKRASVVGDHDADEARIARARASFTRSLYLPDVPPSRVPSCDDPNSSLPHDFDEIAQSQRRMREEGYWPDFFEQHLFSEFAAPPDVLGLSIMGPIQVPLSLLLATLSKARWPSTLVVAGGSHVTLLASRIADDPRFAGDIDCFLPGHSEHILSELIRRHAAGEPIAMDGVLRAGRPWRRAPDVAPESRLAPAFEPEELEFYRRKGRGRLTLPIQIGRGCAYGRCTYCTYPVVEEFERVSTERQAKTFLPPMLELDPHFISVKDSLFTMPSMETFGRVLHDLAPGTGWSATTKVGPSMTPARMQELHDMGCRTLEMGIETIFPEAQALFDKREPLDRIEAALDATLSAGICAVVNMIYGMPGQTIERARQQMAWWQGWRQRWPGRVFGVHNLLQIDEGSPLGMFPERFGLELSGCGPWAFTYVWNAPSWRPQFEREIARSGGRAQ